MPMVGGRRAHWALWVCPTADYRHRSHTSPNSHQRPRTGACRARIYHFFRIVSLVTRRNGMTMSHLRSALRPTAVGEATRPQKLGPAPPRPRARSADRDIGSINSNSNSVYAPLARSASLLLLLLLLV